MSTTPPGWYPDAQGQQRYFDGTAWTQHVAPPTAPAPVYVQQAAPTQMVTYKRKRTSHLFHLVMTILTGGLWGLFVWLPLTAWHSMGPKKREKTRLS